MKLKCAIDYNLLGVLISSVFIIIPVLVSYSTDSVYKPPKCASRPRFVFTNDQLEFNSRVYEGIEKAKRRVLISEPNLDGNYLEDLFKFAFKSALDNGAYVSFLLSENSSARAILEKNGLNNITEAPIKMSFIVMDDLLLMYSPLFTNKMETVKHYYVLINNCTSAVEDAVLFFNHQWIAENNKNPRIFPRRMNAITSLIEPLRISQSNSSLYFFYNSPNGGGVGRYETSDTIPDIVYGSPYEIFLYLDMIPSLESDQIGRSISFFTVFKRYLFAKQNKIHFLLPKKSLKASKAWLDATAAFDCADIRLYNESGFGPNFIVIGNRTFLFSHSLKGKLVDETIGFHLSSNDPPLATVLMNQFNAVWEYSDPYTFNQTVN